MLIHKATMGVLDRLWTGEYRRSPDGMVQPADRWATPADVERPEEWWEVPSHGPLARTIRTHYPWLEPQVDEAGALIGVTVLREGPEGPEPGGRAEEAGRRGYRRRRQLRPTGLMPFLVQQADCLLPGQAVRGRRRGGADGAAVHRAGKGAAP